MNKIAVRVNYLIKYFCSFRRCNICGVVGSVLAVCSENQTNVGSITAEESILF